MPTSFNGSRRLVSSKRTVSVRPRYALIWAAGSAYSEREDIPLATIASEGMKLWLEAHGVDAPYTQAPG